MQVAGCACSDAEILQHVISMRCKCAALGEQSPLPHLKVAAPPPLQVGSVSFALRLRMLRLGRMIACTGRTVHGELAQRATILQQAQLLWSAVGFAQTMIFAQTSATCKALQSVQGLLCEQRAAINVAASARSSHLYEQPVLHAVCLMHARAARAEFLALADTDDFAPRHLPLVLDAVRRHGRLAGVRLFFDADQLCPPLSCPSNESDWHRRCVGSSGMAQSKRRNHWKPIVIPNRTREVAVHQFWPLPPYLRKQVWRVCYSHRHVPPALDANGERYEKAAISVGELLV